MKSKYANNKGSALLISMALVIMLTLIGMMSADRATQDIFLSYNQFHSEQAFYVADAGLNHAVQVLSDSSWWRQGFDKVPFFEGTYSVTIQDSTTLPALGDTLLLTAVGVVNGATSTIEILTGPKRVNPFMFALFARDNLAMRQDACTDSYRSDSGTYAATDLQEDADIGANGLIALTQGATVGGDASSATNGGITFGQFAVVLGDTTTSADPAILDLVPQSEYDWAESVNLGFSGMSGSGFSYNSSTNALSINRNGNVTLANGVYYFSTITLKQNAQLLVAPGEDATLYVTGNISIQQDASFNAGGSPVSLIIYSQGAKFSLFQDASFYGGFYGPNVVFKGRQDMGMYGSVVAAGATLFQDACLHYDRRMSEFSKIDVSDITVIAWRER